MPKQNIGRFLDPRLGVFWLMKSLPIKTIRPVFLRKYYGRLRKYNEADLEAILARLPARPVIVDLGANTGSFTRAVAGIASEIHAVEPDPAVFTALEAEFGALPHVRLINAAVGPADGEITFYREAGFDASSPGVNSVGSSVFADHEAVDRSTAITTPQVGIETLLREIGKPVDLIKIDIEGAEVPVLETLFDSPLLSTISEMVVETHEHVLPALAERTDALRRRAARMTHPRIDFNWR